MKAARKLTTKKRRPKPATTAAPLATRIPKQVLDDLDRAIATGRWAVAVFYLDSGQVKLQRTRNDFPVEDVATACRLLDESLRQA